MAYIDIQNVNITVSVMDERIMTAIKNLLANQIEHIGAKIRQVVASTEETVILDDGLESMAKGQWLEQASNELQKLEIDLANLS
jgi:hypothetical protein